ncbi:MAG: tyrosine-type recombinase/integrase [Acidimicrobiales bacterium]
MPPPSARRAGYVRGAMASFYEGIGMGDVPLANPAIEAWCLRAIADRSKPTRGTYRSVLRQLSPDPRPRVAARFAGSVARPAYSAAERAELWSIACSQPRPWRRRSALCLMALSMGAGLRAGEVVACRREHLDLSAGVIAVSGNRERVVPLGADTAQLLGRLHRRSVAGYLFHPEDAERSYANFVNDFCANLVAEPGSPRLSVARLRASYVCDLLAWGTQLAEILFLTGIEEVESLLYYSRQVPSAPHSKAALRKALAEGR